MAAGTRRELFCLPQRLQHPCIPHGRTAGKLQLQCGRCPHGFPLLPHQGKRRDPHGPEVHQAEHRGLRRHDLLHMDGQAAVGGRPRADKGEQCHHLSPAHAGPRPADDPQRGHPYEPRGQRQGFLQQAGGYAAPAGRCRRGRRAEKADRRRAAGRRRPDPWQRPVPLHPRKGRRLGLQ